VGPVTAPLPLVTVPAPANDPKLALKPFRSMVPGALTM